jgi:hypothetical protein
VLTESDKFPHETPHSSHAVRGSLSALSFAQETTASARLMDRASSSTRATMAGSSRGDSRSGHGRSRRFLQKKRCRLWASDAGL